MQINYLLFGKIAITVANDTPKIVFILKYRMLLKFMEKINQIKKIVY